MPGSPKWSLSLIFPHQNPLYASPLPHTRYMSRPSNFSRIYQPNSIGWAVQIIKSDNWPYPEPHQSSQFPVYRIIKPLILTLNTTWMWFVGLTCWSIYPHFKTLPIHRNRRLIGPQSKSTYFEKEKILLPCLGFETLFPQPLILGGGEICTAFRLLKILLTVFIASKYFMFYCLYEM